MRASCGDWPRLSTHFSWGAPKIRAKLRRRFPDIKPTAISTVHAVLDRNGLVSRRRERHHYAAARPSQAPAPSSA
jgi:putative transposase